MIGRLALRSLTAHPVRSLVLAAGFGVGVGVMAILLGVAAVVLEQAQSPALVGGGDVLIQTTPQTPAQLLLSGTLLSDALRPRVRTASPYHDAPLYLTHDGTTSRVDARGGIPSLEKQLGDPETGDVDVWRDTTTDAAWAVASPEAALRQVDRFHPVPDVPEWADSWAEWLYFNGRSADARFYLTFLVGPVQADGRRGAGVRLQLERHGRMETFGAAATITAADALRAPDLTIGRSFVRLEGLRYHVHLELTGEANRAVTGDLTIEASPGELVPPLEISGARGWRTGYVVPVMSGTMDGELDAYGTPVSLRGSGYHDHNWGFWKDVSWQWGQVQYGDLSFLYGRVFPPREAADPARMPGFVGALGPDGPLGHATNVQISEENDDIGRPVTITIDATGPALTLNMLFTVESSTSTQMAHGPMANGRLNFLQLRGTYTVTGNVGSRQIEFSAPGAAETFRGQ